MQIFSSWIQFLNNSAAKLKESFGVLCRSSSRNSKWRLEVNDQTNNVYACFCLRDILGPDEKR